MTDENTGFCLAPVKTEGRPLLPDWAIGIPDWEELLALDFDKSNLELCHRAIDVQLLQIDGLKAIIDDLRRRLYKKRSKESRRIIRKLDEIRDCLS